MVAWSYDHVDQIVVMEINDHLSPFKKMNQMFAPDCGHVETIVLYKICTYLIKDVLLYNDLQTT
jgi:hypothetical protein